MSIINPTAQSKPEAFVDGAPEGSSPGPKISIRNLTVTYGDAAGIQDVTLDIRPRAVTAFIGASGCGKSTLLRTINRMHETDRQSNACVTGSIQIDGIADNILDDNVDVIRLRSRIGMVFQKPNPFPKTIFNNIAFGLRLHEPELSRRKSKSRLQERVAHYLEQANLWDEVKDRLHTKATKLSGGQQQRLCIARALAVRSDVLLMDEPASALDPESTLRLEDLMDRLKEEFTLVVVTHNMEQARRIADDTVFFDAGRIVETGKTEDIFLNPQKKRTQEFICGKFS